MGRILRICVTLLFTFSLQVFSQTPPAAGVQKNDTLGQLTRIAGEIYDAGASGNKAVIQKYFADAFLETDVNGELRDKKWNMENFLPKGEKMIQKIEDAQVREYEKVAVLYYKWVVEFGYEGNTVKAQLRVTDTFIKTDKGWSLISSHRTRLRDPDGTIK